MRNQKPSQLLLIIFFAIIFIPTILLSRELDLGIISMSIFVSLIGSLILYLVITLIMNIYDMRNKKPSQLLLIIFFTIIFIPTILLSKELDLEIISMSIFESLIGSLILYLVITLITNIYNRLQSF